MSEFVILSESVKYSFEFAVNIEIRPPFDIVTENEKWLGYVRESSEEFAAELLAFISKHPLVESCTKKNP